VCRLTIFVRFVVLNYSVNNQGYITICHCLAKCYTEWLIIAELYKVLCIITQQLRLAIFYLVIMMGNFFANVKLTLVSQHQVNLLYAYVIYFFVLLFPIGIVYYSTSRDAIELAKQLAKEDIDAMSYHAEPKSAAHERSAHQAWSQSKKNVIVATSDFGMGINKSDVRFVVHYTLSKSLESYYQESGRAGRDGLRAHCIIMWRFEDVFRLAAQVCMEKAGITQLHAMVSYVLQLPGTCRLTAMQHQFGPSLVMLCGDMCDNCTTQGEQKVFAINIKRCITSVYHAVKKQTSPTVHRLTGRKLVDILLTGQYRQVLQTAFAGPTSLRSTTNMRHLVERFVMLLLVEGFLSHQFVSASTSTISYVAEGPNENMLSGQGRAMSMPFAMTMATTFSLSPLKTITQIVPNGIKQVTNPTPVGGSLVSSSKVRILSIHNPVSALASGHGISRTVIPIPRLTKEFPLIITCSPSNSSTISAARSGNLQVPQSEQSSATAVLPTAAKKPKWTLQRPTPVNRTTACKPD